MTTDEKVQIEVAEKRQREGWRKEKAVTEATAEDCARSFNYSAIRTRFSERRASGGALRTMIVAKSEGIFVFFPGSPILTRK